MGLPNPVTWPIAATGIATKNAPFMLDPGGQLVLDNVRQERKDEYRTRPGFAHSSDDDLPLANVPVIATEAPWGGLVGLCRQDTFASAGRIFTPDAKPRWTTPITTFTAGGASGQACAQQTPGLWSRMPVAPVIGPRVSQVSSAEGGGYRLTAWWSKSLALTDGIQVARAAVDGSAIETSSLFGNFAAAIRPRCVYSSVANMLILVWAQQTGFVQCARYSTLTGLQVGTTTTLSANGNVSSGLYLDAIYYGGNTITIAFRDNVATGGLRIIEYNPTTDIGTEYTPGINVANCLSLLPDPDASGTRLVGVCTTTPEVRVIRLNSVGVIQTNHLVEAVDAYNIAGVAYGSGVAWMIAYWGVGVPLRACKRTSGGVTSAVKVIGAAEGLVEPATNAWREPGADAMRFVVLSGGRFTGGDIQTTYLELALEYGNGGITVTNEWAEPQAKMLPLNATGDAIERAAIPQVQRTGTDRFVTALGRITKQNDTGDNQDLPTLAIDAWAVQYMNSTTYPGQSNPQNQGQGVQTQGDAYLPVGNLLHTATGYQLCAHGASAIPYIPTLTPSTAAGTLALKTYTYFVTCLMYDEAGNAWRSPPSIEAALKLTGTDNTITVDAYLTPFENKTRRRTVEIWRADGDGSTFKLLHSVTDTIDATVHVTYVDNTSDVDGGEPYLADLPATLTPSFSHVAVWGDRMWGVERDFPTRIWFSKPLTFGTLPEFPGEFVVDLDDQFGEITGLSAMDNNLAVFKERATYIGGGEGPDNTGNGQFPTFNRISSETGAIAGSPLGSTGSEVYFTSLGGLFRVSSGQTIDFVGASIDKYLSMPLLESPEGVTSTVVSPGKNEVRVQTTGYRFVHDRIFNMWIRDTGGMVADAGILMTKMLGGTTQVMFTSSGEFWREAADSVTVDDAGNPYSGKIRTAWLRPSGMSGLLRLFRARVLGECTAIGTVVEPTLTVFYDDAETYTEAFQPPISITDATGPIHAEAQVRRQKCTSFSLQLELPTGDASVRLDAWSATVVKIAGAVTMPLRQKWRRQLSAGPVAPGEPVYWFKADAGVTMDGSNRTSVWADQTSNHFDAQALDDLGFASPLGSRPVYTPAVFPSGLAGMDWGTLAYPALGRYLNNLMTPNVPLVAGAARTLLCLFKPTTANPGRIASFRRSPGSITFDMTSLEHFAGGPGLFPIYAFDRTAPGRLVVGGIYTPVGPGTPASNTTIDYTNTALVVSWVMDAVGNVTIYVNGVLRATFNFLNVDNSGVNTSGAPGAYPLQPDNGASGFMLGNSAIDSGQQLSGFMGEQILYAGTSAITRKAAEAYLRVRGGL